MADPKDKPAPAEPIGNPPAGGSWKWQDGRWQRTDVEQTREQPTEE